MAPAKSLTFHVAEDAGPERLLPVLETLRDTPSPGPADAVTLAALVQEQYGVTPRSEPIALARALGLISLADGYQLTSAGRVVVGLRPPKRADVLHYLLYSAWDAAAPARNSESWSYRTICNALWTRPAVRIGDVEKDLVEEVISHSRTTFADVPGYNPNAVSFSGKSVRGVKKWLDSLTPPVLADKQFSRRTACSAELLMLAVGYMGRLTEAQLGIDLLLTPERRTTICQVALLDPAYLDRLLDWLTPIYPQLLIAGTRTGSYGRFVRLLALPTVEDVA